MVSSRIATILEIKLKTVKEYELSEDERGDKCSLCFEDLFTKRRKRRSRTLRVTKPRKSSPASALQVARLQPCGHLFHRACINEWIVCEKEFDNPVADDDAIDELLQDNDGNGAEEDFDEDLMNDIAVYESLTLQTTYSFESNYIQLDARADDEAEDEAADENIEWIELPNGWRSADGRHFARKPMGVTSTCPFCRSDILPAEEDFNFKLKWTAKERKIAKEFFHDEDAKERLQKCGESEQFAKDLMAARRFAQKKNREGDVARSPKGKGSSKASKTTKKAGR